MQRRTNAAVIARRTTKAGDNMKTTKVALGVVAAVLIAVLAGYFWGAAGRRTAEREVQGVTLRVDLLEARGALLAARVDLYNVNFGNASRHLQEALDLLRPASTRLKENGRAADAQRLDVALARIEEAQRLTGKLDQGANARAGDAAAAIDEILQNGAKR
jgi:hypothetical protein